MSLYINQNSSLGTLKPIYVTSLNLSTFLLLILGISIILFTSIIFSVIIQYLESKMFLAAKELRFEDAAYLRDKIKDIKEI
ncbi:unnamed protein product [marine sediment metagenome]|uniref:UVR domain-containing protein n=1 Tax=marine sediment metagenome TaxID=412755 RepID=X1D8T7_9ZZZZ